MHSSQKHQELFRGELFAHLVIVQQVLPGELQHLQLHAGLVVVAQCLLQHNHTHTEERHVFSGVSRVKADLGGSV